MATGIGRARALVSVCGERAPLLTLTNTAEPMRLEHYFPEPPELEHARLGPTKHDFTVTNMVAYIPATFVQSIQALSNIQTLALAANSKVSSPSPVGAALPGRARGLGWVSPSP